ncbi:ABC-2 family transporter protein [Lapidilactobacillus bayanensis]|uniref:ABC-2 family transporter protein n=1 Tax=Lapidilactobacillus bayanensis TaxID=2485998 RepID=UPI000F793D81|nr:ABC-2 family transporter protein [Lapidilactobacillus bayanensis]
MSKYCRTFLLSIKNIHLFKLDFYLSFIAIPIQILVTYFFWRRLNLSESSRLITVNSLLIYYFVMGILQISFGSAMYVTYELWQEINQGTIITWLNRPIYYPLYVFAQKIAQFLMNFLASLVITFTVFWFVGYHFAIITFLIGILSSLLGFLLLFQIQFIIGTLTFWLKKVIVLRDTIMSLLFLLGGFVLPIDLTPQIIQRLSFFTPTPYIYYLPTKILSGQTTDLNLPMLLCVQLFWVMLLQAILMLAWHYGSHDHVTQGA